MQADQVPGMRRLMPAMQQHDRRRIRRAPFQEVEPQLPQHDVARPVWRVRRVRNAEIGGAGEQQTELLRLRHVERFGRVGEAVQVHGGSRVAPATFGQAPVTWQPAPSRTARDAGAAPPPTRPPPISGVEPADLARHEPVAPLRDRGERHDRGGRRQRLPRRRIAPRQLGIDRRHAGERGHQEGAEEHDRRRYRHCR